MSQRAKIRIPWWRTVVRPAIHFTERTRDHIAFGLGRLSNRNREIRVYHSENVPASLGGPNVRLHRMNRAFPNDPKHCNVVYTVSGSVGIDRCRRAQESGAVVVTHVNSVAHRLYLSNYETLNARLKGIYDLADAVVFGSRYAAREATRFLGPCDKRHEVIHNAVDLNRFTPPTTPPAGLRILVMGVHAFRHRIEPVLLAFERIARRRTDAALTIAGPLVPGEGLWDASLESFQEILGRLDPRSIRILGPYTQPEAPRLLRQATVLVHVTHMDWTPNTVIEALACGVPVVYSGNGGVPELVGGAGVSLGLPDDWDAVRVPGVANLVDAIEHAAERRAELGAAGRARAQKMFDLTTWNRRHRDLFRELLREKKGAAR